MFRVTRFDGSELIVNAGHLLLIEHTPDTVLVLTTGDRIMVREGVDEVISRVVNYRRRISHPASSPDQAAALRTITRDAAEIASPEESEL